MFGDLDHNGQVDANDDLLGFWYLDEAAGLEEKFLTSEDAQEADADEEDDEVEEDA